MAKKQQQKPQKQRKWSSAVGGSETLATATGTVMLLDRSQCHAHLKDDTTTAFYTCSTTTNNSTNNFNNNNNNNNTNNLQHHRNMEKVRLPVMICHLRHLITVAGLLLLLVAVGGAEGRRHAPLMFEESDTGRRSNRPAGKCHHQTIQYRMSF